MSCAELAFRPLEFSPWSSDAFEFPLNALDFRNVARVFFARLEPMAFWTQTTAVLKAAIAGNLPRNVVVIFRTSYDFT